MLKATATGRLVKDASVFTYDGGSKSGINFTLACNLRGKEEPVFINCTQFGRDENTAMNLTMGNQIIVHGDLDITNDGNGNYYTKIIVQEFEFGAKKM